MPDHFFNRSKRPAMSKKKVKKQSMDYSESTEIPTSLLGPRTSPPTDPTPPKPPASTTDVRLPANIPAHEAQIDADDEEDLLQVQLFCTVCHKGSPLNTVVWEEHRSEGPRSAVLVRNNELKQVNNEAVIFTTLVPALRQKILGRVAVLDSYGRKLVENCGRNGYLGPVQFRLFCGLKENAVIHFVVPDKFERSLIYSYNALVTPAELVQKTQLHIAFILKNFLLFNPDIPLSDFSHVLASWTAEIQNVADNYGIPMVTIPKVARMLSEDLQVFSDPITFMKLLLITKRMRAVQPKSFNPPNHRDSLFMASTYVDPQQLQAVFETDLNFPEVRKELLSFVDDILRGGNMLHWALLCLVLDKGNRNARGIVSQSLEISSLETYLDFLPREVAEQILMDSLRQVKSLSALYNLYEKHNANALPPLTLEKIESVVKSQFHYKPPPSQTNDAAEEHFAMWKLLLMVSSGGNIDETFSYLTSRSPGKVEYVSHLAIDELLQQSLLPALTLPVRETLKLERVDQVCRLFSQQLDSDAEACKTFLGFIQQVASSFEDFSPVIERMLGYLPSREGVGLCVRLRVFAVEDNALIVQAEERFIFELLKSRQNRAVNILNYVWKHRKHFLVENRAHWKRTAWILAVLWEEIIACSLFDIPQHTDPISALTVLMNTSCDDGKLAIGILTSEGVRSIYSTISKQLQEMPKLKEVEPCATVQRQIGIAEELLNDLAEAITSGNIFWGHLLLLREQKNALVAFLPSVVPHFDLHVLSNMFNESESIRDQWQSLLNLFTSFVSKHPRFASAGEFFAEQVRNQLQDMERLPLSQWRGPDIGGADLALIGGKVLQAQNSFVFSWIWKQACDREKDLPPPADFEACLEDWKESVSNVLVQWAELLKTVQEGSCAASTVASFLAPTVQVVRVPDRVIKSVEEAQEIYDRHVRSVDEHRQQLIAQEIGVVERVLSDTPKINLRAIGGKLKNFVTAWSFRSQADSLCSLLNALNCPLENSDALLQFCATCNENAVPFESISNAFDNLRRKYPAILFIFDRFSAVLFALIQEVEDYGFLTLLKRFMDIQALNQHVARLINEVDPKNQPLLLAFQDARTNLEAKGELAPCFAELCSRSTRSASTFIKYLSSVSWCFSGLRQLQGGVSTLIGLFNGGINTATALAAARALLYGGTFEISLPSGELTGSGLMPDQKLKTFTQDELGDVPYQLCLVGSAVAQNPNEDRLNGERQTFLALSEKLSILSDVLKQLSAVGHPNFQSKTLRINGSIDLSELSSMIQSHKDQLVSWERFLSVADDRFPLLSGLTRTQLVNGLLSMSGNSNADNLATIVRSVFVNISFDQSMIFATQFIENDLRDHKKKNSMNRLARRLHDLLQLAVEFSLPEEQASSEHYLQAFLNILPRKIKDLSGVTMIRFMKTQCHDISGCIAAFYIALLKRRPSSLELLVCTNHTSEEDLVDFIRRWSVSHSFGLKRPMLFSMVNATALSPKNQSTVLGLLATLRKKAKHPLIISAAADKDIDSIICGALSHECISDVANLLEAWPRLIKAWFAKFSPSISIVSSKYPCSGKTQTILREKAANSNRVVVSLPFTDDLEEIIPLLLRVSEEARQRGFDEQMGLLLHLNVTNNFSAETINSFMLQYILAGTIFGSRGEQIIRNAADHIVIEWSSEGFFADRAWTESKLLACCKVEYPPLRVDAEVMKIVPISDSKLFYTVEMSCDEAMLCGLKMAHAFFNVPNGAFTLPPRSEVEATVLPTPETLYAYFSDGLKARLGKNSVNPSPNQIYRFLKFFARQLAGLNDFVLYGLYEVEKEDPYIRLCYHFAQASYDLAMRLSWSSWQPLTEEVDEDARLSRSAAMSFEDWRDQPFLIFEGEHFEVVSVRDKTMSNDHQHGFLNEITSRDNNRELKQFIRDHNRSRPPPIIAMCKRIADEAYNPLEERDDQALKRLIPMLSSEKIGHRIFNALEHISRDNLDVSLTVGEIAERGGSWINPAMETLNEILALKAESQLTFNSTLHDVQSCAREWIVSMVGSYDDPVHAPYILTVDNLVRMLAIKLRLACHLPVVFIGETGCGKTHLVSFFCRITGSRSEIINIHGGMTPHDLLHDIEAIARRHKDASRVIVLLDEVNSMPSVWTIKELVCDRIILGYRIPDNIHFICIMNPYRRRAEQIEARGLDFSPYVGRKLRKDAKSEHPLVYQVYRAPESLLLHAWDYGQPSNSAITKDVAVALTNARTVFPEDLHISDETIFAESMVHWTIRSSFNSFQFGDRGLFSDFARCDLAETGGERHLKFFRTLMCSLFDFTQRFMREKAKDESGASLRDIHRTVSRISFLMNFQQRLIKFDRTMLDQKLPYFAFLNCAIHTSFVLNYALRLSETDRQEYLQEFCHIWESVRSKFGFSLSVSFLPTPDNFAVVYASFDSVAVKLCNCLAVDQGMAINEAMKENVFSLFCSIMGDIDTGTAQFIVGRPGSTKSYSLDVLCASTDPTNTDPRTLFFKRGWPKIEKFVLQCTPDTKAIDIEKLAKKAANFQFLNEKSRCILVLEEVGVTVGSKHNPLMVLHGLIDRGVTLSNGATVRLPIVGISNWRLDASKMNRMRVTFRGNPSEKDLFKTAECIIQNYAVVEQTEKEQLTFRNALSNFVRTFRTNILANENSNGRVKDLGWFYGMRDFYGFIQMIQYHRVNSLSDEIGILANAHSGISPDLIRWAAKVNFGGHIRPEMEEFILKEIQRSFFPLNSLPQSASWVCESEREGEVYLCDMCARIRHYVAVRTSLPTFCEIADRRQLFRDRFCQAARTMPCNELRDPKNLSCLSVISYSLNLYLHNMQHHVYRVRHVLLFTRATAALQLLYALNVVRSGEAATIFGRADPNPREILEDLLNVRRCMMVGGTLILVGAQHIYESLFDALNQHYWPEGSGEERKYFTRLTMNGYTTSFPIHANFRCIVIEQEATSDGLFPPFLNRFVKSTLNYSSALSSEQRFLAEDIERQAMLPRDDRNGQDNLLSLVIPGYSMDTLHSLIFSFSAVIAEDRDLAREVAMNRLKLLFCPRRFAQLQQGLFENLTNNKIMEVLDRWTWNTVAEDEDELEEGDRVFSFEGDLKLMSTLYSGCSKAKHVMIITEQRDIQWASVQEQLHRFTDGTSMSPTEPLNLNRINSNKDVINFLGELYATEGRAFAVAIFDATCAQDAKEISDQFDRFIYSVSSSDPHAEGRDGAGLTANASTEDWIGNEKQVILICIVHNSSIPSKTAKSYGAHCSSSWHLTIDEHWKYLFVDEISLPRESIFPLFSLLQEDDVQSHVSQILDPKTFSDLVAWKSLSIVQRLVGTERSVETVAKLCDLLRDMFCEDNGALIARILMDASRLSIFHQGAWRKLALQRISFADSLCAQLTQFLGAFVERTVLVYMPILMAFGNHLHCLDPLKKPIFEHLIFNRNIIPEQDLSSCVLVNMPPVVNDFSAKWKATTNEFFFANIARPSLFPFSAFVFEKVDVLAKRLNSEELASRLQEMELLHFSKDELLLYMHDVLLEMGLESAEQRDVFLDVLSIKKAEDIDRGVEKDDYVDVSMHSEGGADERRRFSLISFHCSLHREAAVVDALLRFLQIPGLNLQSIEIETLRRDAEGALIAACPVDPLCPLLPSDMLTDIMIILGEDSLCLKLHRAVVAARSWLSSEEQHQVAALLFEAQNDSALDFARRLIDHPVSLTIAKQILPLSFSSTETEEDRCELLKTCLILLRNFHKDHRLANEAIAFIFEHLVDCWIQSAEQEFDRIFSELQALLARDGFEGTLALIFSRCVYNLCRTAPAIGRAIEQLQFVPKDDVRRIIASALITSGLDLIHEKLAQDVEAEEKETSAEEKGGLSDADARNISAALEDLLSHEQYAELFEGSVLFFLRKASNRGLNPNFAATLVQKGIDSFIPASVGSHPLMTELMMMFNEKEGINLSPFLFQQDYVAALERICIYIGPKTPPTIKNDIFQRLLAMDSWGVAAAIAQKGFCEVREGKLETNVINTLVTIVERMVDERFRPLLITLVRGEQLPEAVHDLSVVQREFWVTLLLEMCKGSNVLMRSLWAYLQAPPRGVENHFGQFNLAKEKMAIETIRCLFAAIQLAHCVLHPLPQLSDAERIVVAQHHDKISNDLLLTKCPRCRKAFDFFEDCFAVKCPCGASFCGWCLKDCGDDAHEHARACVHGNGSWSGTREEFDRAQRKLIIGNIKDFFQNQIPKALAAHVLSLVSGALQINGISALDIGINANFYSSAFSATQISQTTGEIKSKFLHTATNEPVFLWMSAFILQYCSRPDDVPRNELMNDAECVCTLQRLLLNELFNQEGTAVVENLMSEFRERSDRPSSRLSGKLAWTSEFEEAITTWSELERVQRLPKHFAFRSRFDENCFWDLVYGDERFALLRHLNENKQSLQPKFQLASIAILGFIGEIFVAAKNKQLSRQSAKELTLQALIDEFPELNANRQRLMNAIESVKAIYDRVDRYLCKSKTDDLENSIFGEFANIISSAELWHTLPVAYFLPDCDWREGALPHVLYKGTDRDSTWVALGWAQNRTVTEINRQARILYNSGGQAIHDPKEFSKRSIFQLQTDDVVIYDEEELIDRNLALFVDPLAASPCFSEDITQLQLQVLHSSGIWAKPKLPDTLPQFPFIEDRKIALQAHDVLRETLSQSLLSAEMEKNVEIAKSQSGQFAEVCLSFLELIIHDLTLRPAATISNRFEDLISLVTIPLTPEQELGKKFLSDPKIVADLHTAQLTALKAALWNGVVIEEGSMPLTEEEEDTITIWAKKMRDDPRTATLCRPMLLGLRIVGMTYLTSAQTEAFLSCRLMDFLENAISNFEDAVNRFESSPIADVPLCHFASVHQIVTDHWKTNVDNDGNEDSDNNSATESKEPAKAEFSLGVAPVGDRIAIDVREQLDNGSAEVNIYQSARINVKAPIKARARDDPAFEHAQRAAMGGASFLWKRNEQDGELGADDDLVVDDIDEDISE